MPTGDAQNFVYDVDTRTPAVSLPASLRTALVDVVRVELPANSNPRPRSPYPA